MAVMTKNSKNIKSTAKPRTKRVVVVDPNDPVAVEMAKLQARIRELKSLQRGTGEKSRARAEKRIAKFVTWFVKGDRDHRVGALIDSLTESDEATLTAIRNVLEILP